MTTNDNIRGALLMMASMAAFTFNDTVFKTLSGELPLFQAIFLRGVIVSVGMVIAALFMRQLTLNLPMRDWRLIIYRTLGEIGATICFLIALFNAPIADVTAILQAAPLLITLFGALWLGEKVGWRRFTSISVGLVGVLLIVRPTADSFNPYVLFAVGALFFLLLRDLPTRQLSKAVPSVLVALVSATAITATAGLIALTETWVPVTSSMIVKLSGASVFLFVAYIFAVMVMRVGDIAVVQPFRYTGILWAIFTGIVVFGDVPDALSILGAAIVVVMGVYTFYREGRHRGSS